MEKEKLLDAKIEALRKKHREEEERQKRLQEEEAAILAELGYEEAYDSAEESSKPGEENGNTAIFGKESLMEKSRQQSALSWQDEREHWNQEREQRAKQNGRNWTGEGNTQYCNHSRGYHGGQRSNHRKSDPIEQYGHGDNRGVRRGVHGRGYSPNSYIGQNYQQRQSYDDGNQHRNRDRNSWGGQTNDRPRRGAGRGMKTLRNKSESEKSDSNVEAPSVVENWGETEAPIEKSTITVSSGDWGDAEDQKTIESSENLVDSKDYAKVEQTERGQTESTSTLQPQTSEESTDASLFEDAKAPESGVDTETPSSAFASMSASSVAESAGTDDVGKVAEGVVANVIGAAVNQLTSEQEQ